MTVPVVGVSNLLSDRSADRLSVATDLGEACERVGFITVVGHGISKDPIDEAFDQVRRFDRA